jgi:hypothetical protein
MEIQASNFQRSRELSIDVSDSEKAFDQSLSLISSAWLGLSVQSRENEKTPIP